MTKTEQNLLKQVEEIVMRSIDFDQKRLMSAAFSLANKGLINFGSRINHHGYRYCVVSRKRKNGTN